MANPKILYSNLSNYTYTVTGTSTSANYPLSNLIDYEPSTIWKASTTASPCFIIDFGTAKTCNGIIIQNVYEPYYSGGIISISAASNYTFTDSAVSLGNLTAGNVSTVQGALLYYKQLTSYSRRWWKVSFINGVFPSLTSYCGQIFLDNMLEFTTPYDFGYKTGNKQYETNESVALDGTVYTSQVYEGREIYELKFKLQDDALRTNFQTFQQTVRGKMFPFYFIDADGIIRYMHNTEDYTPVTTQHYGRHNLDSLKMREHSTY